MEFESLSLMQWISASPLTSTGDASQGQATEKPSESEKNKPATTGAEAEIQAEVNPADQAVGSQPIPFAEHEALEKQL